jgi:hypothetical protein
MRLIRIVASIWHLRLARRSIEASICLAMLGKRLYGILGNAHLHRGIGSRRSPFLYRKPSGEQLGARLGELHVRP